MEILIILFCITMLVIASVSRIEEYIKMISVQGLILFIMCLVDFANIDKIHFVIMILETLGLKTIIMPLVLMRIVRKNEITREIEPYISNFYSVIITTVIYICGLYIAFWSSLVANDIRPLHFGLSIATIIAAMFIIVNKKKVITHVLGYMIFENGIFLLSLSMAREMPIIVDLGVFLDFFVGIFILGIFVNKIHEKESENI
jgi:hydrogenase-4 component E